MIAARSNRGATKVVLTKIALFSFAFAFVVLGYLGAKPADLVLLGIPGVYWARTLTIVYFAFFLLMPIYTAIEKTKPVPERVTMK